MSTKEPVHSGTVGLCLPVFELLELVFPEKRKCPCTDTSIDDEQFCDGICNCPGCIDETFKSCLLRAELGLAFPTQGARTSVTVEILDMVHSSLISSMSLEPVRDFSIREPPPPPQMAVVRLEVSCSNSE